MKNYCLFIGLLIVMMGYCLSPISALAEDDGNYEGFEASPEAYNLLPNGQDPPSPSAAAGKTSQFDPYAGPRGYVPMPKTAPTPPRKRGFFSMGKLDPPPKPPAKEPPSQPREFPASVEPLCRLGVNLQGDTPDDVLKAGVYRVYTYGAVIHPQSNAIIGLPSRLELWGHGKKRLTVSLTLMPWQAEPVTALPIPPADAPKEAMLNQGPYRRLVVVMSATGETVKLQYQIGDFHLESPPLPILPNGE